MRRLFFGDCEEWKNFISFFWRFLSSLGIFFYLYVVAKFLRDAPREEPGQGKVPAVKRSLSWSRGVPMASRRGQVFLVGFLTTRFLRHATHHCFNSGTVSTRALCLVLVLFLFFGWFLDGRFDPDVFFVEWVQEENKPITQTFNGKEVINQSINQSITQRFNGKRVINQSINQAIERAMEK